MYKYIFIEYIREQKARLKNNLIASIGLLASICVFLYIGIGAIYNTSFSLSDNMPIVCISLTFICFLSLVFQRNSVFFIHPALFLFTYNTTCFKKVLFLLYIKKTISKIILSTGINLIVFRFNLSMEFFLSTAVILSYLLSCSLIRWMKNNQRLCLALLLFMINSALLVLTYTVSSYIGVLLAVLVLPIFLLSKRTTVDWGKFCDEMVYRAKMNYASNHKNIAELQQIAIDNISNRQHKLKIYHLHLNRQNAILCKAIIESARMSKQVLVVFLILLVLSTLFNVTSMLKNVPLIGDPANRKALGVFCFCLFLVNLKEIYCKQIHSLWDKHINGFFIPCTIRTVIFSYSIICCIIASVVSLALAFVMKTSVINSIIGISSIDAVLVGALWLSKNKKTYDKTVLLVNLLFFAAAWMLY